MTEIELIGEIGRHQTDLINQYTSLMRAKIDFVNKFNEMKPQLEEIAATKEDTFNPFSDAIIDLPDSLNTYNLKRELKRITKKTSALLYGITEFNNQ